MRFTTSLRHGLVLLAAILYLTSTLVQGRSYANRDRLRLLAAVEPPKRPSTFASMDDLNIYLEELRQYYTLLGRPRFGRSVDNVEEQEQHRAEEKRRRRSVRESLWLEPLNLEEAMDGTRQH